MVGLRAVDEFNEVGGADRSDFRNVDIKLGEISDWPRLKVRKEKPYSAPANVAFALLAADMKTGNAQYCAYATTQMLQRINPQQIVLPKDRSTERAGVRRSFTYSPLSYVINQHRLNRGLPFCFAMRKDFIQA